MSTDNTQPSSSSPSARQGGRFARVEKGARGFLLLVVLAVILWFVYLMGSAFLPRWWAQHVADRVDGRFSAGILWGLGYGIGSTLIALGLLSQMRRGFLKIWGRVALLLLIVLALSPNLLTLAITLGTKKSTNAASRTLDVMAPAFRSSMLIGVISAIIVFSAFSLLLWRLRMKKRQVERLLASGTAVAGAVTRKDLEAPELSLRQARKYRKQFKAHRKAKHGPKPTDLPEEPGA